MLKNSFYSLLTQIMIVVSRSAVVLIVARAGGPELQGLYALSFLTIMFLRNCVNLGFDIANTYIIASFTKEGTHQEQIPYYLSSSIVTLLFMSVFLVLFILVLGEPVASFLELPYPVLLIIALGMPVCATKLSATGIIMGLSRFNGLFFAELAQYLPFTLILFAASLARELNIFLIVISWIFCAFIALPVVWYCLDKPKFAGFHLNVLKRQIEFGRWRFLQSLIAFLYSRLDLLVVTRLMGIKAAGIYAAARFIVDSFRFVPRAFFNPLIVHVATHGNEEQSTERVYRFTSLISLCFILIVLLTANALVPLALGQDFKASVEPLYVLVFAAFIQALVELTTHRLYGLGNSFAPFLSLLAAVCTIGPLALLFVPTYGLPGAAAATVAGNFVAFFILLMSLKAYSQKSVFYFIRQWVPRLEDFFLLMSFMSAFLDNIKGRVLCRTMRLRRSKE